MRGDEDFASDRRGDISSEESKEPHRQTAERETMREKREQGTEKETGGKEGAGREGE